MKILKLKYILTLVLVLLVGIFLLTFFLGDLKTRALESDNLPFSLEGYRDYSDYDVDGKKIVFFDTEAEKHALLEGVDPSTYDIEDDHIIFHLKKEQIVAQNERYTMFFNEHNTVVSIADNSTCAPPNGKTFEGFDNYQLSTCQTVYHTASPSADAKSTQKSNLLMRYIGSNGKLNNLAFNTFDNSVLYDNRLKDEKERHYSVKQLDNGIEVLYDIGNFTIINSFFPNKFDREMLLDYFVGNMIIHVKVNDTTREMTYTGTAETWSQECAEYLEENGLATVVADDPPQNNPIYDENGEPLARKWIISDLLEHDSEGRPLNKIKLKMGVHYNAENYGEPGASPIIINPFANSYIFDKYLNTFVYDPISKVIEKDGNTETEIIYNTDWKGNYDNISPYFVLGKPSTIQLNELYDYWYRRHSEDGEGNYFYTRLAERRDEYGKKYYEPLYVTYKENPYDEEAEEERVVIGGFHMRDEDGKFLYDEDGKPVQDVFSIEEAQIQNDIFDESVEVYPPVFRVAMRFVLNEDGLDVTILENSLREGMGTDYKENGDSTAYSHASLFGNMDIMPNFTTNNDLNSEGYIILPDGSGAIMRFNSPKSPLNYQAEFKEFYGIDKTFSHQISQQTQNNRNYMLNMYGFLDKTEEKGVLAIVDRGASQTSVYADFKRAESQYIATTDNTAFFRVKYRESETVSVGTWQTPFTKWSKSRSTTDLVFKYKFLTVDEFVDDAGNIDYTPLAFKYREYLIQKYNLQEKDDTDKTVLFLNMLGAFEKREVFLGIPYKKDYSLTTYKQAKEIIEDLLAEDINDFRVSYSAWTNDAMEPEATSKIKVSKVLGGRDDLYELTRFLYNNNIKFHPELLIATNKGYDYNYGDLKYTARTISNLYAHHRPYELATNVANSTATPTKMVSPRFYHNLTTRILQSYNRFSITGAFLSDIGNVRVGDYRNDIFPERGKEYQTDALKLINEELGYLLLSEPFDYSLQYADAAVNVPMDSSLLKGFDYSIPFYQLAISGLIDYTGNPVNYDSEHSTDWYILKSLETGSNLYYILSYEDTKTLLKTDYTMYFNSYYTNWKNEIIRMKETIDATNIHNGRLISHRILQDNVYQVEYSNGVKIIINYNTTTYHDISSGIAVKPSWFYVIEGGE